MLIYVCISSHGFGHAARQAALLRELHLLCPHWTLVISTMVDRRFLELVFRDIPVVLRPVRWDVGMLQADALGADPAATLEALKDLEDALPQRLDQEVAWISKQDMPVLVIGDIPPVAAELAEQPYCWSHQGRQETPCSGTMSGAAEEVLCFQGHHYEEASIKSWPALKELLRRSGGQALAKVAGSAAVA